MRREPLSIVTRIVIAVCTIISLLLIVGSLLIARSEKQLANDLIAEHSQKMRQSIAARGRSQQVALTRNIRLTTTIICEASASYLYDFNVDGIQYSLNTFMAYPEVVAIEVLQEQGDSFAAAWKTPEIKIAEALPQDLVLEAGKSFTEAMIIDDQPIGSCRVYYDDAALRQQIRRAELQALSDTEQFRETANERLQRTLFGQGAGVLIILLVLILLLSFLLKQLVRRPLQGIAELTQRLSELDLTLAVAAPKRDEIGNLFTAIQHMAQAFRGAISQTQESGIKVATSATELLATAKQQEATMQVQTQSTQQVLQTVDRISTIAQQLSQSMREVAGSSEDTARFAGESRSSLLAMQQAMQRMEEASKILSGKLEIIYEKAENITTIVTTIAKVADQINLISLNAAIEAEKAGEYGHGFSVVAREIRRLADQTSLATLEIDEMVKQMQTAVSGEVMEMDRFIATVGESSEIIQRIGNQLNQVIGRIQELSPRFEHVNQAMVSQSDSAQSIHQAMLDLSEEVQQTAQSLHNSYSAIAQLKEAAGELRTEVTRFKV